MALAAGKKTKESIFTGSFSSFSVKDVDGAREFYSEVLGVDVTKSDEGGLELSLPGGQTVFIYGKEDHEPATFTVLNFNVTNIDEAVRELKGRGISFESFGGDIETDEGGVFRGKESGKGPNIAWFKDPAGNFISIVEN